MLREPLLRAVLALLRAVLALLRAGVKRGLQPCGRRAERSLGFLLRRGVLALLARGAGGVARPPTRLL